MGNASIISRQTKNFFTGSKTPKKSLAVVSQADSSSVWALVPKELVNSDHFKSHILKMQDRPPRGRRPKKASRASHVPEIQQIPFSRQGNIKLQFPMVPPVTTKPVVKQHPGPLPLPLRDEFRKRLKAIRKHIELSQKHISSTKRHMKFLEEALEDENDDSIDSQRNDTTAQSSPTIISSDDDEKFSDD
ncbi:hypothetical protein AVEN_56579-1 [Araneus ventricosus]|uniref:Uncharacterized protein n=1 Tax=Araneus ventricosus TaxID=182803 RepID=A0A4Y2SJ61_ARAVE|nr:hypothetical protein AVEN_56579-1 [Araneus ventricosus]